MKKYLSISSAARIIAAGMLFYALKRHPYSYYTILRWVTCGAALYAAYQAYATKQQGWTWLLAAIALLFNPIFPVGLDRATWAYIDVATGILLLLSIAFVQEAESKPEAKGVPQ